MSKKKSITAPPNVIKYTGMINQKGKSHWDIIIDAMKKVKKMDFKPF